MSERVVGMMKRNLFDLNKKTEDELMERRRVVFFGTIGLFVVLTIVLIVIAVIRNIPPTRIVLNYAPESATVMVNGAQMNGGVLDLEPGEYEIEVKKFGFETYNTKVSLDLFETETVFAILEPSMALTENWYDKSSEDSATLDGEMSHAYDAMAEQMVEEFPVTKKLPVKFAEFNIYYGECGEGSCEIIIESEQMKYNEAVQYFYRNLDSDLGWYRFVFINYGNQFQGERDGVGA